MTAGQLAVLVVVYLALDFGNPLLPGAVSFSVADTVEGLRAGRPRAPAVGIAVPLPAPQPVIPVAAAPRADRRGSTPVPVAAWTRAFRPGVAHAGPPERVAGSGDG
jgi:hypothetical protein